MPVMQDVYGRLAPQFAGAFSADSALVTFSGISVSGGIGLITQQMSWDYTQSLQRIHEVGTNFVYFLVGRAQGSMNMQRILGPRPLLFTFYSDYGNACNAATNNITVSAQQGCLSPNDPQGQDTLRFTWLNGIVIQSVQFSVQSEMMSLNETTQAQYVALTPQANVQ